MSHARDMVQKLRVDATHGASAKMIKEFDYSARTTQEFYSEKFDGTTQCGQQQLLERRVQNVGELSIEAYGRI